MISVKVLMYNVNAFHRAAPGNLVHYIAAQIVCNSKAKVKLVVVEKSVRDKLQSVMLLSFLFCFVSVWRPSVKCLKVKCDVCRRRWRCRTRPSKASLKDFSGAEPASWTGNIGF